MTQVSFMQNKRNTEAEQRAGTGKIPWCSTDSVSLHHYHWQTAKKTNGLNVPTDHFSHQPPERYLASWVQPSGQSVWQHRDCFVDQDRLQKEGFMKPPLPSVTKEQHFTSWPKLREPVKGATVSYNLRFIWLHWSCRKLSLCRCLQEIEQWISANSMHTIKSAQM